MNMVGKWKVKKIGAFDMDLGFVMKAVDEIMAMEDNDETQELKEMAGTVLKITDDGLICMYAEMPSGRLTLVEKFPWKEENGEFFFDTGDECEIDGEPADPWTKAEFDEDGLLMFAMMAFEKI